MAGLGGEGGLATGTGATGGVRYRGATGRGVSFLGSLQDALAPPLCCLCRRPAGALPWLCAACVAGLELWRGARCLRCGAPRPLTTPVCGRCPAWPKAVSAARSAGPHDGTARDLVHALALHGRLEAARPLGALVAAVARDLPLHPDTVVVPVPLHRRDRRRLGLHPAGEIARTAARALHLARRPRWLRRVRPGPAGAPLTRAGRRRAVAGAFRAHPRCRGRRVLVVDAGLVTGATFGACARALRRRGAAEIWAVSATRRLRG
ncbi:MAG: ComF family protein [Planctomycetota bacterium]